MLRRTNNTKSLSKIGFLVSIDPNNYDAFIYTTPNSTKAIGVCTESVAYRKPCNIATIGDTTQVFVTGNVVKGDIIRASKSNDRASIGTCMVAKTGDSPYLRIGEALTDGRGLITVILDLTYQGTDDAGWIPYEGWTRDANAGDHFITGRFIVRPGEATVGLAGMVFQAGTLLTVPFAGTMEFDGTGIYFTNTNHRRFLSMASDSLITTQVATTIAPTLLWTGITNANELKAHRVYVIKACGLYVADAIETATITLDFGATTIGGITTPVGVAVLEPWHLEIFLTIRTIGVMGTISAFGKLEASTGSTYGALESFVLNTTIANDLKISCSWSNVGQVLGLTQAWLAVSD